MLDQLALRSNPKQTAHIITNEYATSISQQSIYRHIWNDRANGSTLYKHLRRKGKRYKYKSSDATVKVTNKQSIEQRPSKLNLLIRAGHWEIDTIFGLDQKSFLLTLVDITAMYTIIRLLRFMLI